MFHETDELAIFFIVEKIPPRSMSSLRRVTSRLLNAAISEMNENSNEIFLPFNCQKSDNKGLIESSESSRA